MRPDRPPPFAARVHDRTVAEDYYAAMARIEAQLSVTDPGDTNSTASAPSRAESDSLLGLLEALAAPQLDDETRLRLAARLMLPATITVPARLQ